MRVLFLFLAVFPTLIISHSDIRWSDDNKLSWSDYSSREYSQNGQAAYTFSKLDYSYSWVKSGRSYKMKYDVNTTFVPSRSWIVASKRSPELLKHEQLHFDISELHARYLREKFSKYVYSSNYNSEINQIFNSVSIANDRMQRMYDTESQHSMNKSAQEKWMNKIQLELKRMERYK